MTNIKTIVKTQIKESAETELEVSDQLISQVEKSAQVIVDCYKKNRKVLLCGNGGSAADAQHLAAELINKFRLERKALSAIALTSDSSVITAIANDYGFSYVFARQIEAFGKEGDILVIFTTSDVSFREGEHSSNLGFAIKAARKKGLKVIGFLSLESKRAEKEVDLALVVPSNRTPRIQESHITIGHIICGIVEKLLFGNAKEQGDFS